MTEMAVETEETARSLICFCILLSMESIWKQKEVDIIQQVSTCVCVKMLFRFYQTVACISDSQNNIWL